MEDGLQRGSSAAGPVREAAAVARVWGGGWESVAWRAAEHLDTPFWWSGEEGLGMTHVGGIRKSRMSMVLRSQGGKEQERGSKGAGHWEELPGFWSSPGWCGY